MKKFRIYSSAVLAAMLLLCAVFVQAQGYIRFGSESLLHPYYKVIEKKWMDFKDGSEPGMYYVVVSDTAKERKYWEKQFIKMDKEFKEWDKKNVDSCVGCIFLGLNREEWKIKDKPYWDSIDIKAIKDNGGWYMGDLPSSMSGRTTGRENYYEVSIYHPSVDSTQIEKHYLIRRRSK
jgi:hypothetical protein